MRVSWLTLPGRPQSFFAKGHTFAKPADITLGIEELLPAKKDASERVAKAGDVVDVAYVGKLAENGEVFESSSLVFVLGDGNVIKAWDEGVVGMREGQQRRLTCPPKLAYGKRGSPPEIGPDATLIFDITFRGFRTVKDIETFEEEEEEEEVDEEEEEGEDEEETAAPKKVRIVYQVLRGRGAPTDASNSAGRLPLRTTMRMTRSSENRLPDCSVLESIHSFFV